MDLDENAINISLVNDLLSKVKNIKDIQFIDKICRDTSNNLLLYHKSSGLINAYDFEEYDADRCFASQNYSSIARKIKYKNLKNRFKIILGVNNNEQK